MKADRTSTTENYDLTCWYLNQRRVLELIGNNHFSETLQTVRVLNRNTHLWKLGAQTAFKEALSNWLQWRKPPTLGKLLVGKNPLVGAIFTHYSNWFCKGTMSAYRLVERGKPVPPSLAYSKLDDLRPGLRIECRFHHEHLTSSSAWTELSGQKPLLVVGLVTSVTETVIDAIPFVIASPMPLFEARGPVAVRWGAKLECYIDGIDSFDEVRRVQRVPHKRSDLEPLRVLSEEVVKTAFADIIGEPHIPKDWAGERSDLFSAQVKLDGERVSTAFAFKGPAQFRPMTMATLGKNGDQIDRLFSEPADLLVLQHCHEITPPVRSAIRAYAQQMGNPRLFCLIDGYDTLRVLTAYRKCGFGMTGSLDG